jgi:hypothetical protein
MRGRRSTRPISLHKPPRVAFEHAATVAVKLLAEPAVSGGTEWPLDIPNSVSPSHHR